MKALIFFTVIKPAKLVIIHTNNKLWNKVRKCFGKGPKTEAVNNSALLY